MKFSVLISVYKNDIPDELKSALDSIWINQSRKPNEIVVVIDGPIHKDLLTVITEYKNIAPIKILQIEVNQGLGKALSLGLAACSYDYVARMDSDDISHKNRFKIQLEFIRNNPQIDVIGSNIGEFSEDPSKIIHIRKVPKYHKEISHFHKMRNAINHVTVFFKKESVLDANGYLHMPYFEDYFLWSRMIMAGALFYNIQEPLVYVRVGKQMVERRKGLNYIKCELNHYKSLKQIGFINTSTFIKIIIIRIPLRLLPTKILGLIYSKIIRKSPNE